MRRIVRFGVSMEEELLRKLDERVSAEGYATRSEALRDLVRNKIVEEQWGARGEVAGTILLVFDHHRRRLVTGILRVQHDHHGQIVSTQHVHCDADNCLEVIVFRGAAGRVRKLFAELKALKGVKFAALSPASTGRGLA